MLRVVNISLSEKCFSIMTRTAARISIKTHEIILMIDAKIIGMSEMNKCTKTEIFLRVMVQLVAEILWNYRLCNFDTKIKNTTGWKPEKSDCSWI